MCTVEKQTLMVKCMTHHKQDGPNMSSQHNTDTSTQNKNINQANRGQGQQTRRYKGHKKTDFDGELDAAAAAEAPCDDGTCAPSTS
eukprot:m.23486 g.23486  ORF g.23486 m.23486 type:complete len:86 (+) comp8507_c0_seq1:2728-2985(+)